MGIGTSLLLIAIGAVLRFAVTVSTHGFNIHTIGVILMIVGVVGLIISLFWLAVWRDRRAAGTRYVEREVPRGMPNDATCPLQAATDSQRPHQQRPRARLVT